MIIGFGNYLKDYLELYNISQKEFALRLGITPKHLNEIINKNIDMSDELIGAISSITGIQADFIFGIEQQKKNKRYFLEKFHTEKNLKKYINNYEYKEIEKLNWVHFKNKNDTYQMANDILNFIKFRNFDCLEDFRNHILFKRKETKDYYKLVLWLARCDEISQKQKVNEYSKDCFDKIIKFLEKERMNPLNIEKLKEKFNNYGIYFVIEEALKGSKIRGSFKVKGKNPAIYLTKLYKDKASFYYALYHELGHLKTDFNKGKNKVMIVEDDSQEKRADEFAQNQMIPVLAWKNIQSNMDEKELLRISKKNHIPMCFITTRLAYLKIIEYNHPLYIKYKETI